MAGKQKRRGRPPGSKKASTKAKTGADSGKVPINYGVKDEIWAIIIIALGLFLVVAFQTKAAGAVGNGLSGFFKGCFGIVAFALPYYLIVYGVLLFAKKTIQIGGKSIILLLIIFLMASLINAASYIDPQHLHFSFGNIPGFYHAGMQLKNGGLFGMYIGSLIIKAIGVPGLYIFALVVSLICILLLINTPFARFFERGANKRKEKKEARLAGEKPAAEKPILEGGARPEREFPSKPDTEPSPEELSNRQQNILDYMNKDDLFGDTPEDNSDYAPADHKLTNEQAAKAIIAEEEFNSKPLDGSYELPSVSLLHKGLSFKHKPGNDGYLKTKMLKLEKTLQNFGIDAKIVQVTQGPAVTRYEIQPNVGVKVKSIVNLADDIALNMEAKSIRIEAPIPGKAAVGIEVENEKVTMVTLREIIDSEEFAASQSKITFAVGKDIAGNAIVADLKAMPHLLIAGATNAGKSVCIHSIIASILYKANPNEVKLVLIDPKVVELTNYNGIPHLLIPVVTEPGKAAAALNWAVAEMNDRYKKFAEEGVRELAGFNSAVKKKKEEDRSLPQIVIIIDELADLMMAAPAQVEESICRLAQKARAAGMHLIVATQRPSVDIITGVIKANIPSRIALAVSSQFDSRTILDMAGAEKLVGKGDMLFSPMGSSKPVRVQGTFISDSEVHNIIEFVKGQAAEAEYSEDVLQTIEKANTPGRDDDSDELLADAIETVVSAGQASVSMLQRRFRIGYNRAARMIDMMEARGVVGPSEGSKPRQVLMKESDLAAIQNDTNDMGEEG